MPLLSRPGFGPKASLVYITIGCLMDVWVAVWYFTIVRGAEEETPRTTWFWLIGLFLTGFSLLVIGLLLGRIGQSARRSELPPGEAVPAEAAIQQTGVVPPAPPGTAVPAMPAQMAPAAPVAPAPVVQR
jgi:hypothetical protein